MRTTLDLDAEMLREAMEETGAATKKAAVELGLSALLEAAARRRLVAPYGTMPEASAGGRRRRVPDGS